MISMNEQEMAWRQGQGILGSTLKTLDNHHLDKGLDLTK